MSVENDKATFQGFFQRLTQFRTVRKWQARLAADCDCPNRLIRIPTGFGKTAGVVIAWLWHRVYRADERWPRRLVYCLPMRTLVEQTECLVRQWIERADFRNPPGIHVLLGGLSPSDWHLDPEQEAVLIGTQDMLLSRALNRGYGSGRARWPMEFGLLNVDALWVMDEIQLMDVGLATSAQLQGFADRWERDGMMSRPRRTWWMSATLQKEWFHIAPALEEIDPLPLVELSDEEKEDELWNTEKSIEVVPIPAATDPNAEQLADFIRRQHRSGITLAVCNTVRLAVELHGALTRRLSGSGVDIRLIHSRFRGSERQTWSNEFLSREFCGSNQSRIIVSTQVIEAGVDISADVLVTELAPWASLVQRFGRCARYGGRGRIVVIDRRHTDESASEIRAQNEEERLKKRRGEDRAVAMPYDLEEVEAAASALVHLRDSAGPAMLARFETSEGCKEGRGILPKLYPYAPTHVLSSRELSDLFDTGPDLTGADVDISRFIREGEERDVIVWWWPVPQRESPRERLRPTHDALCRVPVGDVRKWLSPDTGATETVEERPEPSRTRGTRPRAWVWSYVDGDWERLQERHLYPGQTILVDANGGGYDIAVGFTGKAGRVAVHEDHARAISPEESADSAEAQEDLSSGLDGVSSQYKQYKTIATHGAEVAEIAGKLVSVLSRSRPDLPRIFELAGILHDSGKAHPAFAGAIRDRNGISADTPLAKAPEGCWHSVRNLYDHSEYGPRPGFRHEVASVLAVMELLWRSRPDHPAMQGRYIDILEATVEQVLPKPEEKIAEPPGILGELARLDESQVNLVLYLIMSHHGKARATLPMSPRDQDNPGRYGDLPIRGIREGDEVPSLLLADPSGREFRLPSVTLHLDPARVGLSSRYGASWVERVLRLRKELGDFQLAWLEALMRTADVRASQIAEPLDPRLPSQLAVVSMATSGQEHKRDLQEWMIRTLSGDASRMGTAPTASRRSQRNGRAPARRRRRVPEGGGV